MSECPRKKQRDHEDVRMSEKETEEDHEDVRVSSVLVYRLSECLMYRSIGYQNI